MSAIEREILEKFYQLQPPAKQRVLAMMEQVVASELERTEAAAFDYTAWSQEVEALREQIYASHGEQLPRIDVVGLLRDIRDGEDE